MHNLKHNPIGIYEKAIPNAFDWETKIKVAKEAGFNFIEISIDESDERLARLDWAKEDRFFLRNLLHENDFHIRSMCLSGHRRYPFGSKNPGIQKKAYEIMEKAIQFAADLGIRNIQLAGYDVYYEEADEDTKKDFISGLVFAANKAAEANVMLSIEIMDTAFIGTISKCMEYINAVNSPWLKIYPDLGNLSRWSDDPANELELGFDHIVAIHLKDTQPNVFKCVPFGEGTVKFGHLFEKLSTLKYHGPFLVEMWADNDKVQSIEETVEHIKSAKEWLRERMGDL